MNLKSIPTLMVAAFLTASLALDPGVAGGQADSSPVQAMRNKISAGDILSAESLLEVYREKHGETDSYIHGLGWLARGALLVGDLDKARGYSRRIRQSASKQSEPGRRLAENVYLRSSIGSAIEVDAQLIERAEGAKAAIRFLEKELDALDPGLVALRSRVWKRINLLSLEGETAPELNIEDFIGDKPSTLQSLRGEPVVLFLWAEWCGDCKSQAALLEVARERFEKEGLKLVTVTRYYDPEDQRSSEKARVRRVWSDFYGGVGELPMLLSTESMERYGGSSTPTYVFVNREGKVEHYLPYRLTVEEFSRRAQSILD